MVSCIHLSLLGLLQLVGLCLFSIGFFPYKTYLPGFSTVHDAPQTAQAPSSEPHFDRLVFVVIDALRNDFILQDTGFRFVNSLIDKGTAIPFTAKATAPTVTMPRLKAMTTGTVPSFLDAILNIAESDTSSSLQHHDNWVYQFKNNNYGNGKNRTLHFFGDDTWLRLFPGMFTKMDGTTSFYVSDTVQVDQNVTRHVEPVLREMDWDAVILHYLGLDHVGHLGGPKSPLMHPKQQEMDNVIETIYTIVADQDAKRSQTDPHAKGTLIILCGDHGMNEAGNHGGSSVGETSAAMVFMSPSFDQRPPMKYETTMTDEYASPPIIAQPTTKTPLHLHSEFAFGYPVIDQVDVVPTLAMLFGFPIPKNSLGKVILDLFGGNTRAPSILSPDQAPIVLRALQMNAHQLGRLMDIHDDPCPVGSLRHQAYLTQPSQSLALEATTAYLDCIDAFKSDLSSTASDYNLMYLSLGCGMMLLSAVVSCMWAYRLEWGAYGKVVGLFVAGYAISVFASSYVEEEASLWYYYLQSFFLILAWQSASVGQWRGLLCIGVEMVLVRCGMYQGPLLWSAVAIAAFSPAVCGALVLLTQQQPNTIDASQSAKFIRLLCKLAYVATSGLLATLVLAYKLRAENIDPSSSAFGSVVSFALVERLDQVALGQLIYNYGGAGFLLLTATLYVSKHASYMALGQEEGHTQRRPYLRLIVYLMTPLLLLLTKPHDSFLFILFLVQFECLLIWQRSTRIPLWVRSFLVVCLCHYGFFVMGRTNSIASIDLSNAYIGVDGYRPLVIGLTTFCSNWSGALWWCMAGWALAFDDDDDKSGWLDYCSVSLMVFSVVLAALSLSVTLLREHLFIWTVFSPKYLYQIAWTVLFFWGVQMVGGSLITGYWYAWSTPHHQQLDDEVLDDEVVDDEVVNEPLE